MVSGYQKRYSSLSFPSPLQYIPCASVSRFPSLKVNLEEELKILRSYGEHMRPMVRDTIHYVNTALRQGKRIVVEGANAAMLDIDFGKGSAASYCHCIVLYFGSFI